MDWRNTTKRSGYIRQSYSINTLEEAIEILKSDEWVDLSECDGCPCTQYYKSKGMEI